MKMAEVRQIDDVALLRYLMPADSGVGVSVA